MVIACLANELCILFTNSKLLMASPRRAGVNGMVNSLKALRLSPRSTPGILLTIFSSATLAHALLAVYLWWAKKPLAKTQGGWPDLQTILRLDKQLPAFHRHLDASERGRSNRILACCSGLVMLPFPKAQAPYLRKAIISSSRETTSWTLTPLTPKSRSMTLNSALEQTVSPETCWWSTIHTGSDSISQNPFQLSFSRLEAGWQISSCWSSDSVRRRLFTLGPMLSTLNGMVCRADFQKLQDKNILWDEGVSEERRNWRPSKKNWDNKRVITQSQDE